jgi:hypothetical protein
MKTMEKERKILSKVAGYTEKKRLDILGELEGVRLYLDTLVEHVRASRYDKASTLLDNLMIHNLNYMSKDLKKMSREVFGK